MNRILKQYMPQDLVNVIGQYNMISKDVIKHMKYEMLNELEYVVYQTIRAKETTAELIMKNRMRELRSQGLTNHEIYDDDNFLELQLRLYSIRKLHEENGYSSSSIVDNLLPSFSLMLTYDRIEPDPDDSDSDSDLDSDSEMHETVSAEEIHEMRDALDDDPTMFDDPDSDSEELDL